MREIVKDPNNAAQYSNRARRWGEDETAAEETHYRMCGNIQRHVMGITAAQFVWPLTAEGQHTEGEAQPTPRSRQRVSPL